MEVKVDKIKGAEIVTVSGKIDAYQSIKLKDALNDIIDRGSKKIIVNLHDVNFLDSTTLGILISALKKIKNKGGEICITRLQPNVEEIFELTRLNKIFTIFSSNEEAIDFLANIE
ncbi:STAS domain-containing protein [Desulfitibacter alkalitolerans]|uniref:STAS domain-containing protein n=1 Tax=Desulfitibacter alkalitolerans TaxID=264641 RepID=UPI0004864F77|nr:STAS domain-containing protein [Desulfitibacter alkalitolerans]